MNLSKKNERLCESSSSLSSFSNWTMEPLDGNPTEIEALAYLVGGFNPSEKY